MVFVTHTALVIAFPIVPLFNCISTQVTVVSGTVVCFQGQTVWMIIIEVVPVLILTCLAAIFASMSISHVKKELFKRQSALLVCYFYFISVIVWNLYFVIDFSVNMAPTEGLGARVGSGLTTLIISLIFFTSHP